MVLVELWQPEVAKSSRVRYYSLSDSSGYTFIINNRNINIKVVLLIGGLFGCCWPWIIAALDHTGLAGFKMEMRLREVNVCLAQASFVQIRHACIIVSFIHLLRGHANIPSASSSSSSSADMHPQASNSIPFITFGCSPTLLPCKRTIIQHFRSRCGSHTTI